MLARPKSIRRTRAGVVAAGGPPSPAGHGRAPEASGVESGRAVPRLADREHLAHRRHAAGVVDVRRA